MCGIAGFFAGEPRSPDALRSTVSTMTGLIAHRGPDADGLWLDEVSGLALGHRRLSVVDLSEAAAQPMASANGRYVISFNGEIYNFLELRRELEQALPMAGWRSRSDTEVLLRAVEIWGLEDALRRFEGMFAFALWDRSNNTLSLARDRFGEKPLYYAIADGAFLFSSELRPITKIAGLGAAQIDPISVDWLLRTSYVPAPLSIFQGVRKLPPASWLTIRKGDVRERRMPQPAHYWNPATVAAAAMAEPFTGNEDEAVDRLEELLSQSIRRRLIADVPIGAMLSGGIDSTCVSAVAQSQSTRTLKTYAIGFNEMGYDESSSAEAVAAALGTDHTTLMLGEREALDAIPQMASIYDEPFADSSQVATFMVCRALRSRVTVALSGDAGDELFGGYTRYIAAPAIWRGLRPIPWPLRAAASKLAAGIDHRRLARLTRTRGEAAERIQKAIALLDRRSEDDLYARLISHWPAEAQVTWCAGQFRPELVPTSALPRGAGLVRRMMLSDVMGYLPNDILTKIDRASMAVALEVRAPFLQPELFKFAWSLPTEMLIKGRRGKQPLRRLAGRHVPAEVVDRPKQGFAIPLGTWLRGPLREWADDVFAGVESPGIFYDNRLIGRLWSDHKAGRAEHATRLWPVLMFEAWRSSL